MKAYYILVCFLLCFTTNLKAQNKDYPQWQHPVLQELRKENKNIIPFYNKDSTAFITVAVIDKKQNAIFWFDCFGYYFDAVPISQANINALTNKTITAFKYYELITTDYLKTIIKARKNLQGMGSNAIFTKYEEQLLQINDSIKYPSTLKKLIELDKQKLSVERQIREFNSINPKNLKDDTTYNKTFSLQYGSMQTSILNGDSITTYYNRIALEPVYKAVLQHNTASISYYNRGNQKIGSIRFEKEKIALLCKEKTDVFLLYRGWLEINRYNLTNSITIIKNAITKIAIQPKTENAEYVNSKKSLQFLLSYATKLVKTTDYKIDYLTTIDRGFVSQCLKNQYRQSTNDLSVNEAYLSTFTRGEKFYELTDMRGNVMAVVTDKKLAHTTNNNTVDYYEPDIVAATDYAPFGAALPGRNMQSDKYRYGFNGKEKDNSTGLGNLDFGARIYDARLGRFLSLDPLLKKYTDLSPYHYCGNNPILFIDYDGKDFGVKIDHNTKTIIIVANVYSTSKTAYDQAIKSANAWNAKSSVVDGYTVTFQVKVMEETKSPLTDKEIIEVNLNFVNKKGKVDKKKLSKTRKDLIDNKAYKDAKKDEIGNLYSGNKGYNSKSVSGDDYVGGVTNRAKDISMNTHNDLGDMGTYTDLVSHEFGHLFGLDDIGGSYFSSDGIMNYSGTSLKSISDNDIKDILSFIKDALNGKTKETSAKVKLIEQKGKSDGDNPIGVKTD